MGTVVVNVMLKPELPDSQGAVLARQFADAGFPAFVDVRQGKRFTLSVAGPVTPEILDHARRAAERLLIDASSEEVVAVRDGADEAVDWDDMPETWEDGDVVTVSPKRDQDLRNRGLRGREVRPENLHDLSGTGGYGVYGVYGGGEDDDR